MNKTRNEFINKSKNEYKNQFRNKSREIQEQTQKTGKYPEISPERCRPINAV